MTDRPSFPRHPRRPIARNLMCVALLGGAYALADPASAQEQDLADLDPPQIFFDVSTGPRYEINRDADNELSYDTRLGVGYFTGTSSRRLSFDASAVARLQEDEDFFTDPTLNLNYAIFSRNTELTFDLSFRSVEVEADDLEDDFETEDLVDNTDGRVDVLDARVGLATGRTTRFGTNTELRFNSEDFSDGADDDDVRLLSLSNQLRFDLDRRITLRTNTLIEHEETDDLIDTSEWTRRFGIGTDLDIDRAWSASIDLTYTETDTETDDGFGGRVSDLDRDYAASFVLTRELRNGTLAFAYDFENAEDAAVEHTLQLRRALELANGANLRAFAGFTAFEDSDTIAIYGLGYNHEILRGARLSLNFDRTAGVDTDDQAIIRTRASAAFDQDLTRRSGWGLSADYFEVEELNIAGTDTQLLNLGLNYRIALTADWNLTASATHSVTYEDGDIDDETSVLSLNLQRRFSFRP